MFAALEGNPRFEKLATGRWQFLVFRRFTKHLPGGDTGEDSLRLSLTRGFTR